MRRARTVLQVTSRGFSWLAGAAVVILMFLIVLEVLLRNVFGSTVGGAIEISEVLLVFMVFFGIAYAQQDRAHVNTDLVTERLSPRAAAVVRVIGLVVAAVVLMIATWATADRAWASMQAGEARFGIRSVPIWPARIVVPVGLFLLTLECLLTAGDAWRERHGDREDVRHNHGSSDSEVSA